MIIFLYAYFIFLVVFTLISIFIFYHIFRFGYKGDFSIPMMSIYMVLSLLVLGITFYYIVVLDWNASLSDFFI